MYTTDVHYGVHYRIAFCVFYRDKTVLFMQFEKIKTKYN